MIPLNTKLCQEVQLILFVIRKKCKKISSQLHSSQVGANCWSLHQKLTEFE